MRRILIIAIPVITLVLFVLIMHSGNFLKRPMGKDDDIPGTIDGIIEAVRNDSWDEADSRLQGLESAWKKVLFRVQFGSERMKSTNLQKYCKIKGSCDSQRQIRCLMELNEAYMHWDELGIDGLLLLCRVNAIINLA